MKQLSKILAALCVAFVAFVAPLAAMGEGMRDFRYYDSANGPPGASADVASLPLRSLSFFKYPGALLLANRNSAIDPATVKHGAVFLANEDYLTASTFSEGLTNYAAGFMENDRMAPLTAKLQQISPEVEVSRQFEYKSFLEAEAFLIDGDERKRAIGADHKEVDYGGSTVQAKTENKGLSMRIDKDRLNPNVPLEQTVQGRVNALLHRLLLSEIVEATGIIDALDGSPVAKVWGTSSDPDVDMLNLIISAKNDGGFKPNTLFIGETAGVLRKTALRGQNTGVMATAGLSDQELAAWLKVDNIFDFSDIVTRTEKGKTKTVPMAGSVVACYLSPFPTEDDPSAVKRFVTSTEGGGHRVHIDDRAAKYVIVTVEHYSLIKQTMSVGAKEYTVTAS